VHCTHAQERQKPVRPGARRKGCCTPWTLPGPGLTRTTGHGRRPVWGRADGGRACAQLLAHRSCGELVGFYYGVWKQRAHPRARAWYHRLALACSPRGFAGTLAVSVLMRVPACGAARSRQACRPEGRRPRCAGDDVVWGLAKRVLLAQVARVAALSLEGGAGGTRHASCVHAAIVSAVLLHGEIRRRTMSFEDNMKSSWFVYKLGNRESCNDQPPLYAGSCGGGGSGGGGRSRERGGRGGRGGRCG